MMTALKYTAIASAFLLTAGSAAFAQNYNQGNQGNQGYTQGFNQGFNQGETSGSQGYEGYGNQAYNQGNEGWNQGMQGQQGWNQGMNEGRGMNEGMQGQQGENQFGSSGQYGQFNAGAGGMGMNEHRAVQQLQQYGFNDLRDIRPMQGWSADAVKNGQRVHIILGDNGEVATFRGRE